MLDAQDLPDSIAGRGCPAAGLRLLVHGGGLHAARVHVAGALDIATGAHMQREPAFDDRVLRLSGTMVVAVLIAAAIVDESDAGGYGAPQAWLCATVLAIGCIVSRGPAKSCSRDRHTEDD